MAKALESYPAGEQSVQRNDLISSQITVTQKMSQMTNSIPKLLVFAGRPGAGKSTLADLVCAKYGFLRIDKDDPQFPSNRAINDRLQQFENSGVDFWETDECKKVLEPALYHEVFECAYLFMRRGLNCIVDAPLLKEAENIQYLKTIEETIARDGFRVQFQFFWFTITPDRLKENIFNRNASRDLAKMQNWDRYVNSIDFDFRPAFSHTIVDTSNVSLESMLSWFESQFLSSVRLP